MDDREHSSLFSISLQKDHSNPLPLTELQYIGLQMLVEMGFSPVAAQVGSSEAGSWDDGVELLGRKGQKWQHAYIRKGHTAGEGLKGLFCLLCGEGISTHSENTAKMLHSEGKIRPKCITSNWISLPPSKCHICYKQIEDKWAAQACKEHIFCRICASDYAKLAINEGKDVFCPDFNCPAVLTVQETADLVGKEGTEEWEKAKIRRNPRYCHCPAVNCSGYIITTAEVAAIDCPVCHFSLCAHCGQPWHSAFPCKSAVKLLKLARDIAVCPNCQRFAEKSDGCAHVKCHWCSADWCWKCGKAYSPTHFTPNSPDSCPELPTVQRTRPLPASKSSFPARLGLVCCSPLWLCLLVGVFALCVTVLYVCWPCAVLLFVRTMDAAENYRGHWSTVPWVLGLVLLWPVGPLLGGVYCVVALGYWALEEIVVPYAG